MNKHSLVFLVIFSLMSLLVIDIGNQKIQRSTMQAELDAYGFVFQMLSERYYVLTERERLAVDSSEVKNINNQKQAIQFTFYLIRQSEYFPKLPHKTRKLIDEVARR